MLIVSSTETSSSSPSTAAAPGARGFARRPRRRSRRAGRPHEGQPRRLLQRLLHGGGECGAVLEQIVPGRSIDLIVAGDLQALPHGFGEVLPHEAEPGAPRGQLQLRCVQLQQRAEVFLAAGDDRGLRGIAAAHRVDRALEFRERTAPEDLGAVDGHARAAGGSDELVDPIERRLARVGGLGALRGARGEHARGLDVTRELRAQREGCLCDGWPGAVAEVGGHRVLECLTRLRDRIEVGTGARLHEGPDGTVVRDQLLEHRIGAAGESLVLVLHDAHGIEGVARRARRQHLGAREHRRHGRQPEAEPPGDAQKRGARAARAHRGRGQAGARLGSRVAFHLSACDISRRGNDAALHSVHGAHRMMRVGRAGLPRRASHKCREGSGSAVQRVGRRTVSATRERQAGALDGLY